MTILSFLGSIRNLLIVLPMLALAAAGTVAVWREARVSVAYEQAEAEKRSNLVLTGLASLYADQINRQILAIDQTLDSMVREWEAEPRKFNLEASRARALVLTGLSRDMFLADENAVIRQSSVSDFLGQKAGDLEVFRDAAEHASEKRKLFLGAASVNPLMRQWHLDAARTLHYPDGSFAGVIVADYRVSAIASVFQTARPPGNGFAALVNLTDGKLRSTYGPPVSTPDTSIADTPMFSALDGPESGTWLGPSAADAVVRLHAFQRLPDRDLVAIVGVDQRDLQAPADRWARQSYIGAGLITGLALVVVFILVSIRYGAHRRAERTREAAALLAAAQALAEVSRASADAVSRRLSATFDSLTDGIAIFDAHLNLVEWNKLFPEMSGVNPSFLRVGTPMEEVLRTQTQSGYFGRVTDIEEEVERRAALLRAGNFGTSQSFHTQGRTIELRCRPLVEGGFVARYTDATDTLRSRQALRDAVSALDAERATRVRVLDAIAHETRLRVNWLLDATGWLRAAALPPAQDQTVSRLIRVGGELADLADDSNDLPRMESGRLTAWPALVAIRPLLRQAIDSIQADAQTKGVTVYLAANETMPAELIADPTRIRRIVSQLLSDAARLAAPDAMWLIADGGGGDPAVALRLMVRSFGVPLPEVRRAEFFRDLATVAVPPPGDDPWAAEDTGLGVAVAGLLVSAMGGTARCEAWSTMDGRTGNDLIVTLPPDLLPGRNGRAPGAAPAEGRPLPRTRVLMIGAPTGLRMAAVTMLRRDGHMVDAAATGGEAMQLLENAPFDIVFVDTSLPDANLETTIQAIRDLTGPARAVPVIAIAPEHDELEARIWRKSGAAAILPDPPTLEDLTTAIGNHAWMNRPGDPGEALVAGWEEEKEEGIPILSAERLAELRATIPADDLNEMAEECIAELTHRLPVLRRALAAAAYGSITSHAHAMVGTAGAYGLMVLETRLRAVVAAVRARRLHTIDGAADVLENDLNRGASALRRALRLNQMARTGART